MPPPEKVGESKTDACEFSTCRATPTIRWKGQVGIPSQEGRQVIQTTKWICMNDIRLLNRALMLAFPINLTPDGWVWIDNLAVVAKGLDT